MRLEFFPLTLGPYSPAHDPARSILGGWLVTSYFGGRADPVTGRPGNHGGMDLAGSGVNGTAIVAPVDGYVNQGWDFSGGGNWTSLVSSDGHRFGFGHASSYAPGVNGTTVKAGTVIAYVGSTGHSTGPHLHFAYAPPRTAGWSDPYDLLVDVSARAANPPVPVPDPTPFPIGADMAVPVCKFPDKPYVFFPWVNGTLPAWQYVGSPTVLDQLHAAGVVNKNDVRMFASGDDTLDSAWEQWDKTLIPAEVLA